MPFALLFIGAILLVAGVRNTYGDLWTLVKNDFTANGGFLAWVAAIAVIGGLGYIPKLKPLSIAFMTLLLLVLVISHNGLFSQLQQFILSGAGQGAGNTGGGSASPSPVTPVKPLSALDQINNNLQGIS